MIFIAIRPNRAHPKGAMTPEKLERLTGLRKAVNKQIKGIMLEFENLPETKALVRKIDESQQKVAGLSRQSLTDAASNKRMVELIIENNLCSLQLAERLKDFAIGKKTNPIHLKQIEGVIEKIKGKLEKYRKMQ